MNAVVLVGNYERTDPREHGLREVSGGVSRSAQFGPIRRTTLDILLGRWTLDASPFFVAFDLAARVFSPSRSESGAQSVTRNTRRLPPVTSGGRPRHPSEARTPPHPVFRPPAGPTPFRNSELTPVAGIRLPANPFLRPSRSAGTYWDGGYSGNPTITPLVRECASHDTLLVAVNPVERQGTPRSAREILDRLNEVSFNATLLKELRMIALLRQVADAGAGEGAQWAGMRMHLISSKTIDKLGASSKFNAEWDFLSMLRDEGRRCAESFLAEQGASVGKNSTLDLDALLEHV